MEESRNPGILILLALLLINSSAFAQNIDHLGLDPVATGLNFPLGIVNAGDGSERVFMFCALL